MMILYNELFRHVLKKKMAGDDRFNDKIVSKFMGWRMEGGIRVRPDHAKGFKDVPLTDEGSKLYDEMFHKYFGCRNYDALKQMIATLEEKRKSTE